jgi:hypothetical protein
MKPASNMQSKGEDRHMKYLGGSTLRLPLALPP